MKIIIPNYIQYNIQHYTLPFISREANEDFFKTAADANQYILNNYCNEKYESYNKQKDAYTERTYTITQMISQITKAIYIIEQSILHNKLLPCLINDYQKNTNYKLITKFMTKDMSQKYESQLNELKLIHKSNLQQRYKFIKDNKNEIIEYLYLIKQDYIIKNKNKKSEYYKNYHQKRNILLGIQKRQLLTEEQKIINRRESQKKYRNIKTKTKNIIENKSEKELLEIQIKRREYNRRYIQHLIIEI